MFCPASVCVCVCVCVPVSLSTDLWSAAHNHPCQPSHISSQLVSLPLPTSDNCHLYRGTSKRRRRRRRSGSGSGSDRESNESAKY
ncbi:hypothetical protein LX32DRAFT_640363 [Colletotrichum zoysiae]|uniref:Secreted protein n=1 Tax=Colletotrichum zoysiae TaxID=1216348 RepID=A0AAD9HHE2_9PEZI|nr:hypothetical protein LX32DRAFT_640363 [Colletotrichum zoysiae]